ncbi:RGS domain-containing protein [Pilobolus umbonatus]|nr:RGS domain-containing protein [Pilobolus umbonatus]
MQTIRQRRASSISCLNGDFRMTGSDLILQPRTRKSISKSRRSSFCCIEDGSKPSSRRTSMVAAISLLSLSTFMEEVSSSLDLHKLYRTRLNKSSRKLNYFFGESTPLDVCIHEIEKEGLRGILESKVPLCYFLYYLLDEFSSENLFFFLDVENFEKSKDTSDVTEQKTMRQFIYDTYISADSYFEINVDDKIRRNITNHLSDEEVDFGLFHEAKVSIYTLLEASFSRFTSTAIYKDMLNNCGELNTVYDDRCKKVAIEYLLGYIRQVESDIANHADHETALGESLVLTNINHRKMITAILNQFILKLFGSTVQELISTNLDQHQKYWSIDNKNMNMKRLFRERRKARKEKKLEIVETP